jgi:hypothetical protein
VWTRTVELRLVLDEKRRTVIRAAFSFACSPHSGKIGASGGAIGRASLGKGQSMRARIPGRASTSLAPANQGTASARQSPAYRIKSAWRTLPDRAALPLAPADNPAF